MESVFVDVFEIGKNDEIKLYIKHLMKRTDLV